MTQAQLARRARVSVSTIRNLEHGGCPRQAAALRLAEALNVEADQLWDRYGSSRARGDDPPARALRLERNLSQADVAKGAGLKPGVVHRADVGRRLSLATVAALATFYGVHPDAIQSPAMDASEAGAST